MTIDGFLLVTALLFTFISGLNDGGAVLSLALTVRSIPPIFGLLLLVLAIVLSPMLLGTSVATTFTDHIVTLGSEGGRRVLLIAVAMTVVVTGMLARRGLPTSLTLGLLGAIAGAGLGSGLPVHWDNLSLVLIAAAAAPLFGLSVGHGVTSALRWVPGRVRLHHRVRRWHIAGFGLLCLGYGANDAQKMLALFAVSLGPTDGPVTLAPGELAAIGSTFLLGAVAGLPRFAGTLGSGLVAVRPPDAVTTELSAGAVVLATGVAGAPVSMTQAASGALLGVATGRRCASVRWDAVVRIAGAWVLTLPAALVLSWLTAVGATVVS